MIIKVNGKRFTGFSNYNIKLKYNAIASSFSFNAKENFITDLLGFPVCEIIDEKHGLLLTGVILAPNFKDSARPELTQIFGYTKTGVLEDCTIGIDNYPLQNDNLTFREIAEKLCDPFGIKVIPLIGAVETIEEKIETSTPNPDQTIKDYLTKLGLQKGLILSSTRLGSLLIVKYEGRNFKSVETFKVGSYGIKSMTLNIDTQKMHSEITVMKQASTDNPDAGQFTIYNPYVQEYRPTTKILRSGNIFDVEKAARLELSNELNNIKLSFATTKFVAPGNIVTVQNKNIMINKPTQFFVEETVITGTEKETDNYVLTCVPIDVYTTNEVINIFI